ncbi:Enamine deaminase RidA, house cleaning of reactive enamine intermediates, YjgF/YER057c/UK114 family [Amycolatopsis xylanica]|uniref:Enamine deaminase RidA, house cleaning of reactive enamine intermediates, YjgF/YER057c/UK114 family n=1 Tax=Amycolatopsis xylanica TaxID=589385 RepID=A0A1H3NF11_9PSEU|nr:RidA family protein [Amycolatopsis xylanica]SDY87323.1 Enamine deaminase RidA, house cleaning of reactive enamine intermediates, YjgF/YER057c/UK114 family [Amycolatopsis xylanica]
MPITDRLTEVPEVKATPGLAHAVTTTGRLAFVTGQIGVDAEGKAAEGFDAQVRLALENLGRVITELGATWSDVVKFGWYLTDASKLPRMREIRAEVLGERARPAAATLIEVSGFAYPSIVFEVDAVVALPS